MERDALWRGEKEAGSDFSDASRDASFDTPLISENEQTPSARRTYEATRKTSRALRLSTRKLLIFNLAIFGILGLSFLLRSSVASFHLHIPANETTSEYRESVSHQAFFKNLYDANLAGPGTFPLEVRRTVPEDLCQICDCHATPAFYSPAPAIQKYFPSRPLSHEMQLPDGSIDTNEMVRRIILDTYCARQHLTIEQASKLLHRSRNLGDIMSWSLGALQPHKPTIYLTTVTSPYGKALGLRPQYFRRHGRAIRSWGSTSSSASDTDSDDNNANADWQVIWIVAEDEDELDPQVLRTLRRTGVPYIYFSFGMTASWGNPQKNAVLQVAHALSPNSLDGGLLGHGPIYGLDDDNKILPDLLSLLIKVQRIGAFQIGGFETATAWEGPQVDDDTGEVKSSNSPFVRRFGFDYGAFTFNSSLLGTVISGPSFWKWTEWAGETEFMEQVVGAYGDFEPLCGRTSVQDCHYVWHNEPLTELQKMTDDEEIAYVKKYGAEHYFRELGLEVVRKGKDEER